MTIDRPTARHYPALKALWQEAFGDSAEFVELFFQTGFDPQRCRIAAEGEQLLGALYWFECFHGDARVAYLYAVGVRKDARGRGVGRRLMEDTHRHLERLGFQGAVLCPANGRLFGYYAAMGYRTCAWVDELHCAAGEPVALRAVTPEEYAVLRRALLPDGGVVQEGEQLTYLAAFTQLYAGEGFVLAANRSGKKLVGAELLGNTAAAPGIVAALGCTEGSFRVPGEKIPFAIYRGEGEPPRYFGLDLC